ncbi:hypothetical protein [Pseudoalteromonas rubra]|uniref:Uncharacterized protein n=1 Tax=Pseudoalteromonas rubra TaxID=43658 RepID=A0A0U2XE46_9GAMM|nr:hypothetical protein [Pseudoalteromonas rubra]ALU46148.1 hypothetical protein AT705_24610 [Pseudoalteromonas rubra]
MDTLNTAKSARKFSFTRCKYPDFMASNFAGLSADTPWEALCDTDKQRVIHTLYDHMGTELALLFNQALQTRLSPAHHPLCEALRNIALHVGLATPHHSGRSVFQQIILNTVTDVINQRHPSVLLSLLHALGCVFTLAVTTAQGSSKLDLPWDCLSQSLYAYACQMQTRTLYVRAKPTTRMALTDEQSSFLLLRFILSAPRIRQLLLCEHAPCSGRTVRSGAALDAAACIAHIDKVNKVAGEYCRRMDAYFGPLDLFGHDAASVSYAISTGAAAYRCHLSESGHGEAVGYTALMTYLSDAMAPVLLTHISAGQHNWNWISTPLSAWVDSQHDTPVTLLSQEVSGPAREIMSYALLGLIADRVNLSVFGLPLPLDDHSCYWRNQL